MTKCVSCGTLEAVDGHGAYCAECDGLNGPVPLLDEAGELVSPRTKENPMDISKLTPLGRELVKQGLDAMVSRYAGYAADAALAGKKDLASSYTDTARAARELRDRVEAIQRSIPLIA